MNLTPSASHGEKLAASPSVALDDVLKQHGRLTLSASLFVALRVADEVRALNAQGRHVGAIPASRVRCGSDGSLELAKGRFPSNAPELKSGEAADVLSDVYEVGSLIYRLLTGHRPHGDYEAPSAINPAVDTSLDELVMEALAADPAMRPHSIDALLKRIHTVFAELDLEPSPAELARFVAEAKPAARPVAKVDVKIVRRAPPRAVVRSWTGDDEEEDLEADEIGEDGGTGLVRAGFDDRKDDRKWAIASAVFAVVMLVLVL